MWTYEQSTGLLRHPEHLRTQLVIGYSGYGSGKNNPDAESLHDVGPIPRGFYTIGSPECVSTPGPHGPYILRLTPAPENDMHGRDGFLIHGDSMSTPGTASHGCIIVPRPIRTLIATSGDPHLHVTA